MSDFILIYMTASSEEEARRIVQELLRQDLIACANLFQPHTSIYRRQGKVEETRETAVVLKTRAELFGRVKDEILKIHSYDCPCIVSLPVADGHEEFLGWIKSETII